MSFVIVAVFMMAFQGCGAMRQWGNAIVEGGGSESYTQSAFGVEFKMGGETRYGSPVADRAQDYILMSDGVSITAYPYSPAKVPNSGTWKAVRIQWNGGKTGSGIFVINSRRKANTDVTRMYSCTITWKLYVYKTAGGKSIEKPIDEYINTYYVEIKHVGLGK
ncbi:MAG: hypothetical protein WC544_01490 [Patescibacteria group bacterium]